MGPADVISVFSTLYKSISAGLQSLKPGNLGSCVDRAAREVIVGAGYPDYNHATGHPIAEVAHSPGTLLAPGDNSRSQRPVQENGTYTIEPRCQVPNGGSIEEMAVATSDGGITLCNRQSELWVIGRNI